MIAAGVAALWAASLLVQRYAWHAPVTVVLYGGIGAAVWMIANRLVLRATTFRPDR